MITLYYYHGKRKTNKQPGRAKRKGFSMYYTIRQTVGPLNNEWEETVLTIAHDGAIVRHHPHTVGLGRTHSCPDQERILAKLARGKWFFGKAKTLAPGYNPKGEWVI